MSYIPMMAGHWKRMSAAQSTLFQQRLPEAGAGGAGSPLSIADAIRGPVRYLPLACYPGWVLTEADLATGPGQIGTINILYGPGAMWLVDGTSPNIHMLNAGELRPAADKAPLAPALAPLDSDVTGPQYLRFFCGAVWGADGPFTIIEDGDHPVLAGATGDLAWLGRVEPLAMRADGSGFVADAIVNYGQDVFRARFRVSQGMISMEDDEMLAQGVLPPRMHRPPLRDLRPALPANPES